MMERRKEKNSRMDLGLQSAVVSAVAAAAARHTCPPALPEYLACSQPALDDSLPIHAALCCRRHELLPAHFLPTRSPLPPALSTTLISCGLAALRTAAHHGLRDAQGAMERRRGARWHPSQLEHVSKLTHGWLPTSISSAFFCLQVTGSIAPRGSHWRSLHPSEGEARHPTSPV